MMALSLVRTRLRVDARTAKGLCAPTTQDLATSPVKLEDGHVFVGVQD